jgi:hypothetical protein
MSTNAIGPEVEAKKFRKKVADHIRRLSSEFEGERTATVNTLLSLLKSRGFDIHDVADVLEGATGEIGGAKLLTDDDAKVIYERGVEEGKRNTGPGLNPDFYEPDGSPRWHEIALFCQEQNQRLRNEKEQEFIADMAGKTLFRTPTQRQGDWLLAIFYKLGGKRR